VVDSFPRFRDASARTISRRDAREETFQVFRRYQVRNRIVPVVGDFGGTTTLPAVSRYLASQGAVVAAVA